MKLFKYLFEHKLALLIVMLLFCVQAYFDLMLPSYTADIVDVGIQQSGIADALPDEIAADTYEGVIEYLDANGDGGLSIDMIEQAYTLTSEGTYQYDESAGVDREALCEVMAPAMVVVRLGEVPDEALIDQQGIQAVKAEYEHLGKDMGEVQTDYLLHIGLLMMLMVVCSCLTHCVMNFFATRTAAKIGRDLRSRLFERVVHFSHREINTFSAASLITRGTNDIQLIQNLELHIQRFCCQSIALAVGGIIMISRTNSSMAWVVLVAIIAVIVVIGVLFAITGPKFKIMQKLVDRVNLVAREILTGMSVVRAFGRESYEEDRFDKANRKLTSTQLFTSRAMALMMPFLMLIMNLTAVLIVYLGAHFIDQGVIQTGDMIAYITYSMVIIGAFLAMGLVFVLIPRAGVAAQRVDEVINTETSIQDALKVYDEQLPTGNGAEIRFDQVTFSYDDTSEPVLEGVSFTAPAGKTTAIIGPTGCGKSTVLKLAERFYEPQEGSILLDGIDIRTVSLRTLHANLGYVPQQPFLFSGTIDSNVRYGNLDASEGVMQRALEVSQSSEFVASKQEGVQSPVSQGGTNVSGGQRQRLAIARALATPARAYLFDDSFSALDYKTDARLREELSRQLSGRTVIIVAQRISTIMNADAIIVLDEGKVCGMGTHAQLMESCEQYRDIAYSQLSEEELKGGVA